MKTIFISLKAFLFMTFLTGVLYPAVVTIMGSNPFWEKANGSLLKHNGAIVGSEFIGQNFKSEKYFWGRPSAIANNPLPSGGSNLGLISSDLKKLVDERTKNLEKVHGQWNIPQDLLYASGSGLDPHISFEAAIYQLGRVAKARNYDANKIQELKNFIVKMTEKPTFGLLGQTRVNVLKLNLTLDKNEF